MPTSVELVEVPGGNVMVRMTNVRPVCCSCTHQMMMGEVVESQSPRWKPGDTALWPSAWLYFRAEVDGQEIFIVPAQLLIAQAKPIAKGDLN